MKCRESVVRQIRIFLFSFRFTPLPSKPYPPLRPIFQYPTGVLAAEAAGSAFLF